MSEMVILRTPKVSLGERTTFRSNGRADGNAVSLKPALVHFENILHSAAWGGRDRGIVHGFQVVEFQYHAGAVNIGTRERKQGIMHPKGWPMRLLKNEEHSLVGS